MLLLLNIYGHKTVKAVWEGFWPIWVCPNHFLAKQQ